MYTIICVYIYIYIYIHTYYTILYYTIFYSRVWPQARASAPPQPAPWQTPEAYISIHGLDRSKNKCLDPQTNQV